jgi:diacylglycerol O-acyltransferase / wax synthase
MNAPASNRRLSGVDAAFLYLERREIPLHIAAVCIFDAPIPFSEFVAGIDSKLHLIPRYRQIVVEPPFHIGYPKWQDDPDFDIRRHIFHVTVEQPGGQIEMEALASRILTQVMDRGKPLWEITLVDGLEGGRGALIAKIHHSLADGIAGTSLMKIMLDPTPEGSVPIRKPPFKPAPPDPSNASLADALASAVHSSLQSMIAAESILLDFAQGLLEQKAQDAWEKLMGLLPELAASSERFAFNKPCTGNRNFCWTEFPLADVQAIRESLGGRINDVVLAIVTRAVARYIKLHGESVKGRFLRVVCPVSVRADQGEALGNQITFLPLALPLDIANPAALLRAVSARTEIMKNARAAHLVALLQSWIGAAPPPLQALFWDTIPRVTLPLPLLNMICTNVPGSPTPLYSVGRKMIASYPHVPTGYELGVNCAVQSYDGKMFCGLTADAHVVPDAGRLRDFILDSLNDLRRAAGVRKRRTKSKPAPPRVMPEPVQTVQPAVLAS